MVGGGGLRRFIDAGRVRGAIAAAELVTSAPIHVSVAPYFFGNVRKTAESAFRRHRFRNTPHRNAVLFFVVPSRRTFAVVGDAGAHDAVGQAAWDSAVAAALKHFAAGSGTDALVAGIEDIARALAAHFPPVDDASL